MELVGLEDLKFSPISGEGGGSYPKRSLKRFSSLLCGKKTKFFQVCLFISKLKLVPAIFFNFLFFHQLKILKILKMLKQNVVSMHLPAI